MQKLSIRAKYASFLLDRGRDGCGVENEEQRAVAGRAGPMNIDAEDGGNRTNVSSVRGQEEDQRRRPRDTDNTRARSAGKGGRGQANGGGLPCRCRRNADAPRFRSGAAKWMRPVRDKGNTAAGRDMKTRAGR